MCPGKDAKSMIEFGKDRPFNDVRSNPNPNPNPNPHPNRPFSDVRYHLNFNTL